MITEVLGARGSYTVLYPSGRVATLAGTLVRVAAIDSLAIDADGGTLTVIDPRAVVTVCGAVVVDPRARRVPAWAREWLVRHPEWPRVATEDVAR